MWRKTAGFLALAMLSVILPSCATVTDEITPIQNPPNLVGKWRGEWGGNMVHPIEMMVEQQQGTGVSGKMTYLVHGSSFTHPMSGMVGGKQDGSVWIVLNVRGAEFLLKIVSKTRLEGMGRSSSHSGPVTVSRE